MPPTHPLPHIEVRATGTGGPRSAEVPFLTLFEPSSFKSAESFGQTMSKVAPLGKRDEARATSKSAALCRSELVAPGPEGPATIVLLVLFGNQSELWE